MIHFMLRLGRVQGGLLPETHPPQNCHGRQIHHALQGGITMSQHLAQYHNCPCKYVLFNSAKSQMIKEAAFNLTSVFFYFVFRN